MSRQPLFGAVRMTSIDLGGAQVTDIPVLDLHEVVAGKLVALIDRQAARDLFDARRILDIPGLDWSLIKAAVLAYGASRRRDWRQASTSDIGGDPRELRQKLAICLPRDRFAAEGGVEAWIAESVALCRERFAPLFELMPGEAAFLDGILDHGVIDPSGLEVSKEVSARIATMPMLAWKCQNVRSYLAKGAK
jgi:hypothetical protein